MELLRDAFTGTPGDALSVYNPSYVQVTGTTGVISINANGGSVNGDATGTAAYIRSDIAPPSADYSVSADITMAGSIPNGPAAGVIGRASSGANTYYSGRFLSTGSGNGAWQIRRSINGSVQTVSSVNFSYTVEQVFNVRLSMTGSDMSLYLNGDTTPILGPTADTGIADAGFGGLYSLNATSPRYRLDNLVIDDGAAAGGVDGIAPAIGVMATASVGSVTASAGAKASPAGVSATTGVGTATASAGTSANATPAGVAATAGVGAAVASAGASIAPAGVSTSAQVGTATANAGATASPLGVLASAQVGTASASGGSASTAFPAGVSAVASVGAVSASGAASAAPAGVSASAEVGIASASGGTRISGTANPSGVSASAGVGAVTVSAGASCAPAGVAAFASVGAVIAAGNIAIPATAAPLGVVAYARVGTAVATGGGVFARAPAGAGYTPQRNEYQSRPVQTGSTRPAAIQRNRR